MTTTIATSELRAGSRGERMSHPRARDVVTQAAVEFGVCIRPVLLRRTDTATGETLVIETPCGATRAKVCPSCATRARRLRAQQCREGWHLTEEPTLDPRPGDGDQVDIVTERAALTAAHEQATDTATPDLDLVADLEERLSELDGELAETGARGAIVPAATKRVRSTKRRDDVPDLPRRPSTGSTLGRTFTDPVSGRMFRPSLFVTLTLPSYGKVRDDGTPVNPGTYDYLGAARDALHFGKLLDRWSQNLRRVAGYEAQYFAAVEPQRRLAPHAHYAIRGTLPRALVKELTAATYVNVWWPATTTAVYGGTRVPEWEPAVGINAQGQPYGGYVDPDTRSPLTTWREALDDLDDDPDAAPRHTIRFGSQVDVQGLLAGSPQAEKAIGYIVKYLVKDLGDDLDHPDTDDDPDGDQGEQLVTADAKAADARRADHVARLVEALRHEPCSPACANWLRYGIQPKGARVGMRPGCCRSKAHKPSHLGYGGRRVLVSRKWTAKDLADHKHDRRAFVLDVLAKAGADCSATVPLNPGKDADPPGITWELAKPTDPDVKPRHHRLLRAIAERTRWRTQYRDARDRKQGDEEVSATDDAA